MIKAFSELSTNIKAAIAIAGTIATLVGAVWAVEDRYVDEQEIVQTLQQYDSRVQAQISQIEHDSKIKDYDHLTERYYQLKRMLKTNPNDLELLEEFEVIKYKRIQLRKDLGL